MAETKLNLPDANRKEQPANKKRLYLLLAVLGVMSIAAVLVNYVAYKARQSEAPADQTSQVSEKFTEDLAALLPQLERVDPPIDSKHGKMSPEGLDPFAAPMELLGVAIGGRGGDLAIIKARQTTYIVGAGDKVADFWQVTAVNRNSVQLNSLTKEIMLELAPRN